MSLEPGRKIGSYEVVGLIGQGGMGQVWQATDTQLNRELDARNPTRQELPANALLCTIDSTL